MSNTSTGVFAIVRLRWAGCVLSAIILSACILSVVWVFRVPLLQNPDEIGHIDYAFTIYSAGRLINVRRPPSVWNVKAQWEGRQGVVARDSLPYELISHQYTLYLIDATDFQRIRFHPEEKVPADYGTLTYYRRLDANAPQAPAQIADLRPQDNPWLITGYPFLYYAILAMWLKLVSIFSSGPAILFIAARFFSVILLAGSLFLSYLVLRELRLTKSRSLVLTAIVGFFPNTSFISSAVQPDNLAWLLMLLSFYLCLLIRRKEPDYRLTAAWGIALGLLLVTKYHFFLFTVISILGLAASEHLFKRRSLKEPLRHLAILILPAVLLFAVQLWIVWGKRITGGNLQFATTGRLGNLKRGVLDFYRGGLAFESYWGTFGWMDTPLIIWSPQVEKLVLMLLSAVTLGALLLVVFRLEQVITRLVVLVGRGRWRTALRAVFSNPLINSNFLFSAFMLVLYALHEGGFNAQGRHWFTYFLSGFLIATQFAPRALTHRKTQAAVSGFLILGLLIYCAVGGYYSLETITTRFYPAP